jgi:hypothetical protein
MKYFHSVLLATMAIIAGVAGNISKTDHWKAAVGFWCLCGCLAIAATIVGYIESILKPHLVPVGYGKTPDGREGLVFINDREAAYAIQPPKPIPFGTGELVFEDPHLTRLTKDGGLQCFPMFISDSHRSVVNDLRANLILSDTRNVLVSFKYADADRPKLLRYTTTCKISPSKKGIDISLEKYSFSWWKLF